MALHSAAKGKLLAVIGDEAGVDIIKKINYIIARSFTIFTCCNDRNVFCRIYLKLRCRE